MKRCRMLIVTCAAFAGIGAGAMAQTGVQRQAGQDGPPLPAQFPAMPVPAAVPSAVPPSYPPPGPASPPAGSAYRSTYPLDAPSSAGASSGGYRPQTQSGSGDEGPRLEAVPRRPGARAAMPPPAPLTRLAAKTENGMTYLCGGIGQDEADEMKEAARGYDLMLTFAARDGSYLADVNVDIADAQDNSLLKTTCNAPIMLVDFDKSGTYRIRAETGGNTVSRSVRVLEREPGKSVVMVWPAHAVRGLSEAQQPQSER